MLGFSTPSYWLAILLMLLFAAKLGWLPAGGFVPFADNPLLHLQYLLLPVLTVAFIEAAEPGQTDRRPGPHRNRRAEASERRASPHFRAATA